MRLLQLLRVRPELDPWRRTVGLGLRERATYRKLFVHRNSGIAFLLVSRPLPRIEEIAHLPELTRQG
jgi:hypothetical protein